jgi:hypothetical protein
MIRSLDQSVGDILDWLDNQDDDIKNNTYIIFCSDNGGVEGGNITRNTPLRGAKAQLYEGGIRVPLIIQGPGIPSNKTCDVPITTADLFPTILEWAAGVAYAPEEYPDIDGVSLTPLLDDSSITTISRTDNAIYWYNPYYWRATDKDGTASLWPSASVLKDGYKLIKFYDKIYTWPDDFDTTTHQLKQTADASYELYDVSKMALSLDGVDDYVVTDYPGITGPASRTVSAWIKVSNHTDYNRRDTIISWGNYTENGKKWLIRVENESNDNDRGVLRVEVQGGWKQGSSTSPNIADGKWHHVAVTWQVKDGVNDISNAVLYVDGNDINATSSSCGVDTDLTGNVKIGTFEVNPTWSDFFNGCLDDVRIYSAASSPDDVLALYNNDEVSLDFQADLQAHWKFDGNFVDNDSNHPGSICNNTDDYPDHKFVFGGQNLYTTIENAPFDEQSRNLKELLERWMKEVDVKMPMARVVRDDDQWFPSIQDAINNSSDGDVITICPGVHIQYHWVLKNNEWVKERNDNLSINKNIVLQSVNPDDPEIVKNTIIDGVITFDSGCTANCKVQGITIFNSSGINSGVAGNSSHAGLNKCVIRDNIGPNNGGGINDLDGTISHCRIENNSATGNGGGLYGCDGIIRNCVIVGNSANAGSAFYWCNGEIINCTVIGNISTDDNGEVLDSCNGSIVNNIIWGNYPNELTNCATPSNCYIGNGTNDPLLENYSSICGKTVDDINTGDPDMNNFLFNKLKINQDFYNCCDVNDIIEYNNDGVLRKIKGKEINYILEFDPPISPETERNKSVYLWPSGTTSVIEDYHLKYNSPCIDAGDSSGDYDNQTDIDGNPRVLKQNIDIGADEFVPVENIDKNIPYSTIQDAIDDANDFDEIVVYPGTFYEQIDFLGKSIMVRSVAPFDWDVVEATIIDANDIGRVVTFNTGEDANSILSGFTITGGYAVGSGTDDSGAGIFCFNTSPIIQNCLITNNYAQQYGGGMYTAYAYPQISNCIFTENQADDSGGAFRAYGSSPVLKNCIFADNLADYGGAIQNSQADTILLNSTFTGNYAYVAGGAIRNYDDSDPTITNCILWYDSAGAAGPEISNSSYCTPTVTYSDVEGTYLYPGTGNINGDPNFVDIYHLSAGSACVDAGTNSAVTAGDVDIDGDDRILDGDEDETAVVDMGADEYHP